jgi:protease IV
MKKQIALSCLLMFSNIIAFGQSTITPYHQRNDFLFTSPGALKFGLYGYDNPALLSYVRQPDILFTWSDRTAPWDEFKHWGLFIGMPSFGFGTVHEQTPVGRSAEYAISFAAGNRSVSTGISYNWTRASTPLLDKSSLLTSGLLVRPMQYVSVGAQYTLALNTKGWEVVGDVAVRPLGSEMVTLFTDYVFHRTPLLHQDMWSAGVAVEPLPGVRVTGRYFDSKAFAVGLQLSLGRIGIESQSHYNSSGQYSYNMYGIRLGAYDRTVISRIIPQSPKFVETDLNGTIGYQRFELFDNSKTLTSLLEMIEAAKNDPSVSGIAINTSGMYTDREKLWELREKLKDFKSAGKKVFVFVDRADLDLYHFVSIADKIVMDPFGSIALQGYVMGRTFVKGTLEKIGIGYDEWRFFKYKSANESFSRDKMSDADREQRQKIVDGWYTIATKEICDTRGISSDQFNKLVDEEVVFIAQQAKERELIDSIGRWESVKELVKLETGKDDGFMPPMMLAKFNEPYDAKWGEPPQIAVIYALGACAMDEGITTRKLVKDLQAAIDDTRIKAIVLRVDSPGGDAMASDYIADVMKKSKGKKPIIVSQGFVAASGGYWLSMFADTIVAAPGTITGSVGVIGGWMYNKSLKESLGMSTDLVKAGAHADLGFGFRLPLIGLGIPDRNLTEMEHARMENMIKTMYKEFVEKVSLGRRKTYSEIDAIGQGRVWTGVDGKQNGLVDVLGGLETAIDIARERAGISKNQEITLIEMPKKGLMDFSMFMPKLFGIETKIESDPTIELLKFRLQHNGEPLPMLPLEDVDLSLYR